MVMADSIVCSSTTLEQSIAPASQPFKPVCDDIVRRMDERLRLNHWTGTHDIVMRQLRDFMQEIQRELTEKANSTPA